MAIKNGKDPQGWTKWVIGFLVSCLFFMAGGFIQDLRNDTVQQEIEKAIDEHEILPGHPVLEQRVAADERLMEQLMKDINRRLERIESKIDRLEDTR